MANDDSRLTVRREDAGDALVMHVAGEVDLATSLELGRALAGLEDEVGPAVSLVIDLTDVAFLSSAGLALLVDLGGRCTTAGVELRIVAGNRTVMRALTTTGLTEVLPVVGSLPDALGRPR